MPWLLMLVTMKVMSISMDWVERYEIIHLLSTKLIFQISDLIYRSIYLNPLNIVWSVFNSIMLMFCNVSLLFFRTASFEANAWTCACRSSFWCRYSNRWNGAWIYVGSKWYNLLTCLNFRCKRFMMSFKLATYATSECLRAGHGNVCVFLFGRYRRIKTYWMFYYPYAVHAMQSKHSTPSLITFQNNDGVFFF